MSSPHASVVRDGQILDVLTDETAGLRLTISRAGAEPVSLARRDGNGAWRGFLYRDDDISRAPSGWNNHSTVMGYYIHRIKNERTSYRGHEMRGGTHSFLRHKTFAAPALAADGTLAALIYQLGPDQIEPHEYPYPVAFALTYELSEGRLRAGFHFANLDGDLSAHVSFGLHPGFAVDSLGACEIILPAGTYVRHLVPDNFLSGETERLEHGGGPMPFDKAQLPGSFVLEMVDVPEPLFVVRDSTRQTELDFHGVPFVTLWSDGGPFVCVEPCWGLPDHHEQRPFEQKTGIMEIPRRGTLDGSFTITPRILA